MEELKLEYYFKNINEFPFKDVFTDCVYPWEVLSNINEYIEKFMNNREMKINKASEIGEFCSINGNYFIDEGTKIHSNVTIQGPVLIGKNVEKACKKLHEMTHEELLVPQNIAKILGYSVIDGYDDISVYTRGYRILNKVPRMPNSVVENVVNKFKSFQKLLQSDIKELDDDAIVEKYERDSNQHRILTKGYRYSWKLHREKAGEDTP